MLEEGVRREERWGRECGERLMTGQDEEVGGRGERGGESRGMKSGEVRYDEIRLKGEVIWI